MQYGSVLYVKTLNCTFKKIYLNISASAANFLLVLILIRAGLGNQGGPECLELT